jgi:hypothetical protein
VKYTGPYLEDVKALQGELAPLKRVGKNYETADQSRDLEFARKSLQIWKDGQKQRKQRPRSEKIREGLAMAEALLKDQDAEMIKVAGPRNKVLRERFKKLTEK